MERGATAPLGDLHAQGKLILGGHQENQSQGDTTNTFIGKARDGHDYQDSATTSRASRLDSGGKIHLKGEEQLILGNVELTSVGKTHLDTPHLVVSPESQLNQHTTEDWDKDRGYRTERGQGKADESLVYGKINAGGGLQIDPGTHISVGIDTGKTGADGQAVQLSAPQYQRIAEQLGQQPGLGYLKDLAGRSDIDWQAVGTAHQQWDYKGQGMTQEGAIVLTIVIAIVTSGAGASAVGTEGAATTSIAADGAVATSATTTFGGTALSTTTTTVAADGAVATSTTYYAAGTALNAGFTSLATSAAISLANNGGDIGKTLHDLGKSDTIKSTATAMITAGLLDAEIFGEADQARSLNQIANTNTVQGLGSVAKFDWNTLGQNVAGMVGRSTISAGVSSIIQGGDFEDNLRNNLINDLAAVGANAIGTKWGSGSTDKNPFLQTAAHGVLGCAVAGARGGDCKSGAVGGIVESTLGNLIGELPTDSNGQYSKLTRGLYTAGSMIAADIVADELGLKTTDAMSAAQNAATNNRLATQKEKDRYKQLEKETGISAERLEAAGCTKIDCKAEFAPGSKEYQNAQRQEERGAEDEEALKVINQEQGKNGEFLSYGLVDKAFDGGTRIGNQAAEGFGTAKDVVTYKSVDEAVLQPMANDIKQVNDTYAVTTRAGGAAQAAGGAVTGAVGVGMVAAGGATCLETGVGCLVAAGGTVLTGWSVDQTKAGWNTLITGDAQQTHGGAWISDTFDLSPGWSEFGYGLIGLSPAVVEGVALNRAASGYAAANAEARGTYAAGTNSVLGYSSTASVDSGLVTTTKLSASDEIVLAGDQSRAQVVSSIGEHVQPALNAIWNLDSDAQIGFRGSLASGLKGPHKLDQDMGPVAFDGNVAYKLDKASNTYKAYSGPQGYDADYFIVSDLLASNPVFAGQRYRNVLDLDKSLGGTFDLARQSMATDPLLSGMKPDFLEFIIRTESETAKLLQKGDAQYYFLKNE